MLTSFGLNVTGKSTLTAQYVDGKTIDFYDPTIENSEYDRQIFSHWHPTDFIVLLTAFSKKVKIRGQEYFLKLVDTAGQDEYSIFPAQYTMDVDGFCLVYSINNQKSFEVVRILYDKLVDLTGKVQ